jgi:hypothetical protein
MVPLPAAELLDDGFADLWAALTYRDPQSPTDSRVSSARDCLNPLAGDAVARARD